MRAAVPILITLMGAASFAGEAAVAPPPATAPAAMAQPLLSPVQRAALDEVYRRAVAAGLPDAGGGTLYRGTVVMSEPATAKPAAETDSEDDDDITDQAAPVRWRHQIQDVETVDGRTLTTFDKGVHLRLADGRWLIGLRTLLTPDATHVINPGKEAVVVAPAALGVKPGDERRSRRRRSREPDGGLPALLTAGEGARFRTASEQAQRLEDLGLSAGMDDGSLSALHLLRLGVPEAEGVLLTMAAWTIFPAYRTRVELSAAPTPLDLWEDRYSRHVNGRDDAKSAWKTFCEDNRGKLAIPDPAGVAALLVARRFHNLLLDTDELAASGLDAARAADGLLAFTPEPAQSALRPLVGRLVARLGLPAKPAADASLAARLQSWEPATGSDNGFANVDPETLASLPPEVQEHLRAQRAKDTAWRPTESDLPALLELLEDARPSRWLDGVDPRSLGDNALRALAALVRFDPRLLIGRDPAAPWSDAERAATSAGLRTWWKGLEGKPLGDGLTAAIGSLPPAAMIRLLNARPVAQRGPMLAAVVGAWTVKPPSDQPPGDVAGVLSAGDGHAGLAALVKTWKPEGRLRPLLACWHDRHGDPASLDALVEELAAQPAPDDRAARLLASALGQSLGTPSLGRLQRCLALAGLPPADRRLWALVSAHNRAPADDESWQAVRLLRVGGNQRGRSRGETDGYPERALRLAVCSVLLADRRQIPDTVVTLQMHDVRWGMLTIAGSAFNLEIPRDDDNEDAPDAAKPPDRKAPTGLRVCDAAANALAGGFGRFRDGDGPNQPTPPPDLWAPVEARDLAVQALAESIAEPARAALTAAKLPNVVPTAAPAAGNDTALF